MMLTITLPILRPRVLLVTIKTEMRIRRMRIVHIKIRRMMMRAFPLKPIHELAMAGRPGQARDFQEPLSAGASVISAIGY